jgi:hypothetical protein
MVVLFTATFGFLTVSAVATQGLTVASLVSFLILLLVGVGIVGALRNPPR